MKTLLQVYAPRSLALVVMMTLLFSACDKDRREGLQPPPPATASSVLQLPDPVEAGAPTGPASLPDGMTLGFAVDLDGIERWDDLNLSGRVTAVDSQGVVFTTDEGQAGRLLYRLPSPFTLNLQVDSPLTLVRELKGSGGLSGYRIRVSDGAVPVLEAGLLVSGGAHRVTLLEDMSLEQQDTLKTLPPGGQLSIPLPVSLIRAGRSQRIAPGRVIRLAHNDRSYVLQVFNSSKSNPAAGARLEAEGYGLDYLLTAE